MMRCDIEALSPSIIDQKSEGSLLSSRNKWVGVVKKILKKVMLRYVGVVSVVCKFVSSVQSWRARLCLVAAMLESGPNCEPTSIRYRRLLQPVHACISTIPLITNAFILNLKVPTYLLSYTNRSTAGSCLGGDKANNFHIRNYCMHDLPASLPFWS